MIFSKPDLPSHRYIGYIRFTPQFLTRNRTRPHRGILRRECRHFFCRAIVIPAFWCSLEQGATDGRKFRNLWLWTTERMAAIRISLKAPNPDIRKYYAKMKLPWGMAKVINRIFWTNYIESVRAPIGITHLNLLEHSAEKMPDRQSSLHLLLNGLEAAQ